MAGTSLMGWRASQQRWVKRQVVDGKQRQFTATPFKLKKLYPELVTSSTKEGTRAAANKYWKNVEAEMQDAQQKVISQIRSIMELTEQRQIALDKYVVAGEQYMNNTTDVLSSLASLIPMYLSDIEDNQEQTTLDGYRSCVRRFVAWCETQNITDACDVKDGTLLDYRKDVRETLKDSTGSLAMTQVWRFYKWLWKRDIITAATKLDRRDITIKIEATDITPFADEEVATLLKESTGLDRLCFLLMLNTGMTMIDIANISPVIEDESKGLGVNWEEGRVTHKRIKTRKKKGVPSPAYKLWDETFDMLKRHRCGDDRYVFLRPDGKQICTATNDYISQRFRKLNQRLGDPFPELKSLRKTSSTKFDDHNEFARYAQFFLGHSGQTLADRRYVLPSKTRFDASVKWLGEQFGFDTRT